MAGLTESRRWSVLTADAAAERAALKGISFSAYARMCMIDNLANEE